MQVACGADLKRPVCGVCTASPLLVMERRKMVRAVGKIWRESGLGVDDVEVLALPGSYALSGGWRRSGVRGLGGTVSRAW